MADQRLTIRLSPDTRRRLAELSRRKGKNLSALVREALADLCRAHDNSTSCHDIAIRAGIVGVVKDAPPDLSTNPNHMNDFGKH